MFNWFQRPAFRVGMIVRLPQTNQCMVIQRRRRVRPNGLSSKPWVYDGAIIAGGNDGSICRVTGISCVLEDNMQRIHGLS